MLNSVENGKTQQTGSGLIHLPHFLYNIIEGSRVSKCYQFVGEEDRLHAERLQLLVPEK